jgi:hypothetical protein
VTVTIEQAEMLVDRYLAAWNATQAATRRSLIAQTWTEDARYIDPVAESERHDGIDSMIAEVQTRFPGMRFARTGKVDLHHEHVRFSWALAPDTGEALVKGTDFATLRGGRLHTVTGFFDLLPAAA